MRYTATSDIYSFLEDRHDDHRDLHSFPTRRSSDLEELQQAGFGSEQEFGIPCPIAFIAPLRLLLYEKVPGTRARTLIVGPSGTESVNAVERCARWLAHFHAEVRPRG